MGPEQQEDYGLQATSRLPAAWREQLTESNRLDEGESTGVRSSSWGSSNRVLSENNS